MFYPARRHDRGRRLSPGSHDVRARRRSAVRVSRGVLPFVVGALVFALAAPAALATGTGKGPKVEVSSAVHHDRSGPLRNQPSAPSARKLTEHPLRSIPHAAPGQIQADPALQSDTSTTAADVTAGLNIAGVGNGDYGFSPDAAPPDTNG